VRSALSRFRPSVSNLRFWIPENARPFGLLLIAVTAGFAAQKTSHKQARAEFFNTELPNAEFWKSVAASRGMLPVTQPTAMHVYLRHLPDLTPGTGRGWIDATRSALVVAGSQDNRDEFLVFSRPKATPGAWQPLGIGLEAFAMIQALSGPAPSIGGAARSAKNDPRELRY
jgi:hypothetical protein